MSTYQTDEEQAEIVKKAIKKYAPSAIVGMILALGINYGIKTWHEHATKQHQEASLLFTQTASAYGNNAPQDAVIPEQKLQENFKNSAYNQLANFYRAKTAVENKNYTQAITILEDEMHNASTPSLQSIAAIRDARIELELKHFPQAIAALDTIHTQSFLGLADVTRGDILLAQQKLQPALTAYKNAMTLMTKDNFDTEELSIKINNLQGQINGENA